jgi:hypothetical protein
LATLDRQQAPGRINFGVYPPPSFDRGDAASIAVWPGLMTLETFSPELDISQFGGQPFTLVGTFSFSLATRSTLRRERRTALRHEPAPGGLGDATSMPVQTHVGCITLSSRHSSWISAKKADMTATPLLQKGDGHAE